MRSKIHEGWMQFAAAIILITWALLGPAFGAPVPCAGQDLDAAKSAQSDAAGTLQSVVNFIKGGDQSTKDLVGKWFGAKDQATIDKVRDIFGRALQFVGNVRFYCLYENDGSLTKKVKAPDGTLVIKDVSGNLLGYVYPTDTTTVYLGLAFYSAPSIGFKSKLGTLVHEMTHYWLVGLTSDIYYGYDKSLALASSDPSRAQKNADNYSYFVEDWLSK